MKFQTTKPIRSMLYAIRNQIGFTLIELVIVIGILAILAVFVLAVVNPISQFEKARDAQRKSDLAQIQRSLEQYYQDNGKYPANNGSYQIVDVNGQAVVWGGPSGWNSYMNVVPKDPVATHTYVYYSLNNQQSYILYASLERGSKDPQACNNGNACTTLTGLNGAPGPNACGLTCNYAISSPNVTP